ncbi:MAG: hypothetical protein K2G69_02540, partial [Muribaculaceae bacterium]|nr:hypothetical protein [Muribaculaceae bacterium]
MRPQRKVWRPDTILSFVNNSDEEVPLLAFVGENMPDKSRNDLKKWLKYGHLMADGVVTTAFDAPVKPGGEVKVNVSRPFVVLKHPRLQLVYEDDDVIVINKGYG